MIIPIVMFIFVIIFCLVIMRYRTLFQRHQGFQLLMALFVMIIAGMPFILHGLFRERPKPPHSAVVDFAPKHPTRIAPALVLQGQTDVHTLAFSADEQTLVSAGHSYVMQLWNLSSQTVTASIHTGQEIEYIRFFPNMSMVLAAPMYGSSPFVWEPATGKRLSLSSMGFQNMVDGQFDFTALNNGLLAGGTYDEHDPVRIWKLTEKTLVGTALITDKSLDRKGMIALSASGELLAMSYNLHGRLAVGLPEIAIFHIPTGKRLQVLQGHDIYWIRGVAFSPDGKFLVSGGEDQKVILWDVTAPENSVTFTGHKHDLTDVDYSPNGRWIVSVSGERNRSECSRGDIRLWDVQHHQGIVRLETRYPAWTVQFSPQGTYVAVGTACDDGKEEIVVWKLEHLINRRGIYQGAF